LGKMEMSVHDEDEQIASLAARSNNVWIEGMEKALQAFDKMNPKDRLAALADIAFMLMVLEQSISGWRQWMGNIAYAAFSEEEMLDLAMRLKNAAKSLVEIDKKYTALWDQARKRKDLNIPPVNLAVIPKTGQPAYA